MSTKYALVQCEMIRPELMGVSQSRWTIWAEEDGHPIENTSNVFYGLQQVQQFVNDLQAHLNEIGYTAIINGKIA